MEFKFDVKKCLVKDFGICHEVLSRVDFQTIRFSQHFACRGVNLGDSVDFVAEQFDAIGVFGIRRKHLNHIAARTERALPEVDIVASILNADEFAQQFIASDNLSNLNVNLLSFKFIGGTESIET